VTPGPWLRLTAIGAAVATGLAVVSGALGGGVAHEALSAIAVPPLGVLVLAAWFEYRRLLAPTLAALVLFGVAALVTGHVAHVALASFAFAASLVSAALVLRERWVPAGSWRDYVALTKPRIMSLLLLTGLCGMIVGAGGWPATWLVAVTMLGLALACGGASALNHVLDRDIDRAMRRTSGRPVAAERVPAAYALEFGLALSALSFVLLASFVNVLTAALALVGGLFYVLVYTRWLKRSTPQNIVIGGAAGAVPPLVGWAAATGSLAVPALFLFLIVFFWTPPHFWALALLIRRDYEAARIPMLPVVRGERATTRQILLYSLALIPVTLLPFFWHTAGAFYLVCAVVLGAALLALAWRLLVQTTPARARLLFHFSLAYLALLFVTMALDPVVA
jgi:protoheme IX farnesyltransferase